MTSALDLPEPVFNLPPLDSISDDDDDAPKQGRLLVSAHPRTMILSDPLVPSNQGRDRPFESLITGLRRSGMVALLQRRGLSSK